MAKLKAENKAMLAYLLFESDDPLAYAGQTKREMDALFEEMPRNQYGGTKTLRKVAQLITRYNRFTKSKQGELELLLHFTGRYLERVSPESRHAPLLGLAFRALRKARGLVGKLHEDLQYDYAREYDQKVQAVHATMRHWDHHRFPLPTLA